MVNVPPRGIGNKTFECIRNVAISKKCSLWQAAEVLIENKAIPSRAQQSLTSFTELILHLRSMVNELSLSRLVEIVIEESGLRTMHEQEKGEKGKSRIENLQELITACQQFNPKEYLLNETQETLKPQNDLEAFLAQTVLESGDAQVKNDNACVQMMTLHSAKGLEFPIVFITGLEEGLFPSVQSAEQDRLGEERRLFYVGITRARQQLYLSFSQIRSLYGRTENKRSSCFINEIPANLLQDIRISNVQFTRPLTARKPFYKTPVADCEFALGQQVHHPIFGEGTLTGYEGEGVRTIVVVSFADKGTKRLMLSQAKLTAQPGSI